MTLSVIGIGLGGLGGLEIRQLAEMDDVRVVAGVDTQRRSRVEFRERVDAPTYDAVEDALDAHPEADAVTIATPHTLHHEAIVAALEAGCHVHVEKPMVTDVGQALDVVDTADDEGLVVQTGYQRRFDPRYREFRRQVDRVVGEPQMVNCYLEQDWIRSQNGTWRADPALSGGGQLYDSGSHLLDVLLWSLDARPREVAAIVDERDNDVDVDSALSVRLATDDGHCTASIGVTANGTTGPDVGERIGIWGTDGSVTFDGETVTVTERDGRGTYENTIDAPDFVELTRSKLDAFVDCIESGADPDPSAADAVPVVALTEAAYRASSRGETVDARSLVEEARAER